MVKTLEGKRHDYYEGILQLRDVTPEFVDMVIAEIETSGKCAISKITPEKGGVDLYMSDQHYTQSLATSLKRRYGGEFKLTKKLYGRWARTGHIVYRVTALFRKLPYNVGDIITTDDGDVKVIGITTSVQVQHVDSKKKESLRFDQLSRFAH